jgi:hypothetical protein
LQGLDGIQAGDKLFVLCWFHMAECNALRIHPPNWLVSCGRPCCRRPDPQGPWAGCRGWDSCCGP